MCKFKKFFTKFVAGVLVAGITITGATGIVKVPGTKVVKVQAANSVSNMLDVICSRDVGSKYYGSFHGAIQCKGYAAKIMNELFGIGYIGIYDAHRYYIPSPAPGVYEVGRLNMNKMNNATMTALLNQCIPGDFIQVRRRRPGDHGHSMIVLGVNATTRKITILDCNADGKLTVQKYVQSYSTFLSKNSAMSVYRARANEATNIIPAETIEQPEITNVSIAKITSNELSFGFNVNNATKLVRIVVINKSNNQETKKDYYPDQAKKYNVTLNFNENAGNEYYIRIYAYAKHNNSYVKETLHTLTYGSAIGVVQLPISDKDSLSDDEMKEICFDYKYYADMNPDVKRIYHYDKNSLFFHWWNWGRVEGRASSPIWNPVYYLANNSDIQAVAKNDYLFAYEHFRKWGYKELRKSSEYYDGSYYLNKYAGEFKGFDSKDILFHFKRFGLAEGRWANTVRYTGSSSWK